MSSLGHKGTVHWCELLFGAGIDRRYLFTSNVNFVTYYLMLEDERQRAVYMAEQNKSMAHDPDAETKARFRAKGRDFDAEMREVKLLW
jgi:hypothetical protein